MRERYDGLDGIRAYSIIGIAMMHIMYAGNYSLGIATTIIGAFSDLVFLFMMVSAFGMCCGYYEKIRHGSISVDTFYSKRYAKIWPYFALLCFLDLIISPSIGALCEVFANLTLAFGLMPDVDIEVIGVAWTLGVIFVFYMLFPFFCYLLASKKKAWIMLVLTMIFNVMCISYFHVGKTSIIYCSVYFVMGGIIYLYRKSLASFAEKNNIKMILLMIVAVALYFAIGSETYTMLIFCAVVLIYALGIHRGGGYCSIHLQDLSAVSASRFISATW